MTAMNDVEFLHGDAILERIEHIIGGDELSIACAFWSLPLVKRLKLDGMRGRFIVDVSMRATDPEALRELKAPMNEHVRALNRLHAKVYLSSRGAVVGSANMSLGALCGFDESGSRRLVEAAVFLPAEHSETSKIKNWFAQKFDLAKPITEAELISLAWAYNGQRVVMGDGGPGEFLDWGQVFYKDLVPEERKTDALRGLKTADEKLAERARLFPDRFDFYVDGWRSEDLDDFPEYFIDVRLIGDAEPYLRHKLYGNGEFIVAENLEWRDYFSEMEWKRFKKVVKVRRMDFEDGTVVKPREDRLILPD